MKKIDYHDVPHDPGLQPERTYQAWGRTLLTLLLNSIFFSRIGILSDKPFFYLVACHCFFLMIMCFIVRNIRKNGDLNLPLPKIMAIISIALSLTGFIIVINMASEILHME